MNALRLSFCFVLAGAVLCAGLSSVHAQSHHIELGPADVMALDQPRVAVEVYIPNPEYSFGPEMANSWLLDTGAQGLLSAGFAMGEMKDRGYQTVAVFEEIGIGGTSPYDVSEIYNMDFAGTSGARNTLGDVRLLSSDTAEWGSFGGIVGMPAMVQRVTSLDLTPMSSLSFIDVSFSSSAPAGNGHRYNVPIQLVDYPATGGQQNPDDPLPTYAPLPFVNVRAGHDGTSTAGPFVLDTGAQMSILSSQFAFALGLDKNGDGSFDDEAVGFHTFGGVGGSSVTAPLLEVDRLILPTAEGIDLIWTDLVLPILDVDPTIEGIFGCDLLTSGYLAVLFGGNGYIDQVHFDFTDSDNLNGTMILDINPEYDNVSPEPATMVLLSLGLPLVLRRRKNG